jgi:DNA-binding beta-propeller fold protein YncE
MSIARVCLAFPIIGALCLLFGCTDRERLNPIDPLNPRTGGKPVGLFAVSMRDTVKLGWQPLGLRDLSGYRIYRQSASSTDFALIDSVAGDQQSYREFGLTMGLSYHYRITAYTSVSESSPSDPVSIVPGPGFVWISDANIRAVIKYTHDGSAELARTTREFIEPERLQANPKTGQLWVIDTFTRELRRIEASGSASSVRIALQNPVDLAVDSTDNTIWAADNGFGVYKYDATGVRLAQTPLPGVIAVAINFRTRELFALDRRQKKLWRIDASGIATEVNVSLIGPQGIAIHRGTGDAWIADSTRVVIVRAGGQIETASGFNFVYAKRAAVNQNTGECWVIDLVLSLPQSKVVKFSAAGVMQFSVSGFLYPSSLSVNVFDGACFVTDRHSQQKSLSRVSASGLIIHQARNFSDPIDVDVENRPLN